MRQVTHVLFSATLVAALLHPTAALAWGNEHAHRALTDKTTYIIDFEEEFTRFLQKELGLSKGLKQPLAVQLGFDPTIDAEIGPVKNSRLNDDQNRWKGKAPEHSFIMLNQKCPDNPPADCFAKLERSSVSMLLRAGAWAEDNPNARARHHFLDPTFEHLPPPLNHGLNDQKLVPGVNFIGELGTWLFRGGEASRFLASFKKLDPFKEPEIDPDFGNFEYRGRSALDRALNLPLGVAPLPSTRSPENFFALPDAERYLYLGLTAPREDEREHYLALHFIAFGHVLHLLQDSSSPPHVRNDFMVGHGLRLRASFEAVGDKSKVVDNILGYVVEPESLLQARPKEFLSMQGVDDPRYLASLGGFALDATGLDTADFWDQGDPKQADGAGLAEVVQRHVFSTGSIGGAPGDPDEYPRPLLPNSCREGDSAGSGDSLVFVAELPARSLYKGTVVNPGKTQSFLSSPMIPHLGRCRFHPLFLGTDTIFIVTLVDESVQRDYLETVWRLAIDRSAKMMQNYYQPRLVLLPQGPHSFKFANPTMLEFVAASDAIEIVYEGVDKERHRVPAVCPGGGELRLPPAKSPGEVGKESTLSCSLPDVESLPEPLGSREDFWIVVRGALGARGAVGTRAQFDAGSEEFVVAFTHVQPEIFFDQVVEDPTQPLSDVSQKVDVYSIAVDLDQEFLAGTSDGQVPENHTAALRAKLNAPELDFSSPAQDPSTPRRLAIRHDLGAPPDQEHPLFVDGTLMELGLLQLTPGAEAGVVLTTVSDSQTEMQWWRRERLRWTPDGRFLFAHRLSASDELEDTRFDLDTDERLALVLRDIFSVVVDDPDTPTVENCSKTNLLSVTPISETEVVVSVNCFRQVFQRQVSDDTFEFVSTEREAASVFLASLEAGEDGLSIEVTAVIDMVSDPPAIQDCSPGQNPIKPPEDPPERRCPPILAQSLQFGEEVFVNQDRIAQLAFLHNLNQLSDPGVVGPLTDVMIVDLESKEFTTAAKDIASKLETLPIDGGITTNVPPSPAHWSPSGGMLAFVDFKNGQVAVIPVANRSELPVAPIPIAELPDLANTLTWGSQLLFPKGN